MNKEKERLLKETYQQFMDHGMGINYNGLGDIAGIVDEQLMGFGSTLDEKVLSLDALLQLLRIQKAQGEGMNLRWEIKPLRHYTSADENTAIFADELFLQAGVGNETVEMYFRFSVVLVYQKNKWVVMHWHGSKPENVESEKDTFGIETWKEKAVALEKLVAERTTDLVLKNRELEIETALERVRSRSMAMHKSEELKEVIQVVYEQFIQLNINIEHTGFIIDYTDKEDMHIWLADKFESPFEITIPYFDSPHWNSFLDAKKRGKHFFSNLLSFEVKNEFYHDLFKKIPALPKEGAAAIFSKPGLAISTVLMDNVGLYIENFHGIPFTDDENNTLMRFGKAFQQTYTRFLDLQKAEAQAREAQIEAALERVRSRTMAMQRSEELLDVASILFQQVKGLGVPQWNCGFNIWNTGDKEFTYYPGTPGGVISPTPSKIPLTEHPVFMRFDESRKRGDDLLIYEKQGEEQEDHYRYMLSLPGVGDLLRNMIDAGFQLPAFQIDHVANFAYGNLIFITFEHFPEMHGVFKRFAKVFEQTYTRFLDLQKAESQARQAKIETALEKVRARALAMQQPEELTEVAKVLRHEMGLLGVEELETCSIFIHDEAINRTECWYALKGIRLEEKKLVSDHFPLNLHDTWVGREMEKFYKSDAKQVSILMQGACREEWIKYCEEKSIPLRGYYGAAIPDRTYHLYKFSHGAIGAASAGDISSESWNLLQRAAAVFSLAYSRFKDLTQARFDLQRLREEKQRAETALSELQTTQNQLIQAEKMASLGELTAGIAHEIQNPLNFVNNFSEVSTELVDEMTEELATGNTQLAIEIANDLKQNLEKINHHGKRAGDIVKGMLQHSRSSSGQKELTDINALCDEYLRLSYHGLRAKDKSFNAKLKTDFDESTGNINIIPQDIGRVILNLITNAFYAVNEKQKSSHPLKEGEPYEPTVTVTTRKLNSTSGEGGKVLISVNDNGNGIPQKILDKIFQPFFTTKPTGQGTGLGLSLSYDIVKAHGGELTVKTEESIGSTFIIQLPAKENAV